MKITFKELWFKNLFSYGDIESKIVFQEGINLITSNPDFRSNGIGKSSALMGLPLVIFGKTPKKTVQSDIINWQNGKDCFVGLNILKDKTSISIERSLKPNNLDLFINNNLQPKESNVNITQARIEDMLKCDMRIFNNLIYCTGNSTSLIDASTIDKRKFLENLFDIEFISILNDQITKKLTNISNQKNILIQQLKIYKEEIENSNKKLKEYDEKIDISVLKEAYEISKINYDGYIKTVKIIPDDKLKKYGKVIDKLEKTNKKIDNENDIINKEYNKTNNELTYIEKSLEELKIDYCGDDKLEFYKNEYQKYQLYISGDFEAIEENVKHNENKKRDIEGEIKNHNFIHKQLNVELSNFDPHIDQDISLCPTCGSKTNSISILEYQNQKKKEITIKISANQFVINGLEKKLINIKNYIDDLKILKKDYEEKLSKKKFFQDAINYHESIFKKITDQTEKINEYTDKLKNIKNKLKIDLHDKVSNKILFLQDKIKDNTKILDKIEYLKKELDLKKQLYYYDIKEESRHKKYLSDIKKEIVTKQKKIDEINKNTNGYNITFDYLSYIKNGCQDKQIKQWIINDSMPYINERANYYLSILGINYFLEISGFLDIKINGLGVSDVNIKSLSSGEQRSVDLAIRLSLISSSQIRNNLFMDILILDEIFDSSLDEEGISQLLKIIRVKQKEDNLKIYITSHRKEIQNADIDHLYEVSKINNFSEIKQVY